MKLLIAISSYRVTGLTIDCLRSLSREIDRVPGTRVGVCENGTGGDAAERLRRAIDENGWGSWVDLMEVYPNRGFTGGNNAVIRPALESDDPPEYVLLLNADTIVLEHALDTLVAFMDDHPKAGMAGEHFPVTGRRSPADGVPLSRGSRPSWTEGCGWGSSRSCCHPGRPYRRCRSRPARRTGSAGAGVILRRTMLEQIGLLDEGLYTYFDDVDMGLRASAGGLGGLVRPRKPGHPPRRGIDRGRLASEEAEPSPGLLVSGAAAVIPEALRGLVHGTGGRRVHPRICPLAAAAAAPAQAGHRPATDADRLDPPQRLLHRVQGSRGRESRAMPNAEKRNTENWSPATK